MHWHALLSLATLALPGSNAASLQKIVGGFGPNPTKVGFYIYVPDKLASKPPILVNPHWCHGDAQSVYSGHQFWRYADRFGFIVIYPDSPNSADKCWDVSSRETLTHNGGGDSLGIVSMVKWALSQYAGDSTRVFATGVSSGAMMTQVLIGAYPEVFAAGSAFSGVPFGCFAPPGNNSGVYDYWNGQCAEGKITHTAEEWRSIVAAAYPGYTGWRPKIQLFHGTNDEILNYNNHLEAIKQWTSVLGLGSTPTNTTANTPQSGWTKTTYGPDAQLEAYSAAGVPHNIPIQQQAAITWFDLECTSSSCFNWGKDLSGGACTQKP